MAAIIKKAIMGYNFVFDELAVPNTKGWFLVARPYEGLTILVVYFLFVFKWGPKLMKNRQPYNLDRIMIIYNAIQIFGCGYIFIRALKVFTRYKLLCEPVDYSESEDALDAAAVAYYYYLSKIADLADTIFFILRKKFNQVSFLHVYHHTGMILLTWGASTYVPGGHGVFIAVINSFVHVVMYSYYLLSVAVPKMKESIRIKKLVTQIQIVQFFLTVTHMGSLVFIPKCAYPRWVAAVFLPNNLFLLILFVHFYIMTYIKKPEQIVPVKKLEKESSEIEDNNNFSFKVLNGNIRHSVEHSHTADSELILGKVKRC